ncbi:hypothetical protein [Enterococcus sp. AZ072]|uniref:hypothetical protein n=1 Tax=unclassified Enterococcus TaxID=2608891 RepID=UPI003D264E0C
MKKLFVGMWGILMCLTLSACGKSVTVNDLKAHDWVMETHEQEEDIKFIASFNDKEMVLTIDTPETPTDASNEWEQAGEELGKELIENMAFHVACQLEEETIHLKNEELELDNDYRVKLDGENVVFTSEEPQETETITLIPLEKTSNTNK